MKLSELAEKLGVPAETLLAELEIDGAGKFSDITSRASRSTELEATLQSKQQALAEYEARIQQLQGAAQQQYQQTGQTPDWYNDEILRPIAESFQSLRQEVIDLQEKKINVMANIQQQFMQNAIAWANQQEVKDLKRENPDFDEGKVRKYAQERGINDWKSAYEAEKATRLPDIIKAEVEKARTEGREQGLRGAPIHTEMGNLNPASIQGKAKVDYNSAWKGLVSELQTMGHG